MDNNDPKYDPKVYGDPAKIVHYMDFSNEGPEADNGSYIPDLVPGLLQLLEVYEDQEISDEILSNLDIESIVK